MIAKQLISSMIMPLVPEDSVAQALSMMNVYHLRDLPVVSNGILLGILTEEDATAVNPDTLLKDIKLIKSYAFVNDTDHVFEVLGRLAENKITAVPVVDADEKFIGIISQEELISFYASSFSFKEPGSILVIESSKRGYALSEIARVIELENVSVLASFLTEHKNSEAVLITLKLNEREISSVIAALERYDYKISASFTEGEFEDDMKERYDQFMNYLNV
jgi:CBS domain-containing protein